MPRGAVCALGRRTVLAVLFTGAITAGAGCRHYDSSGTLPRNFQPPKDSSEAAARKILMPGISSGLTPEAKQVEQDLGYR